MGEPYAVLEPFGSLVVDLIGSGFARSGAMNLGEELLRKALTSTYP